MEVKMAILDGRYLDVCVLVDRAGSDIATVVVTPAAGTPAASVATPGTHQLSLAVAGARTSITRPSRNTRL